MTTLLHVLSFFIGLLPDVCVRGLARVISFFVFTVFRYRRKIMRENIATAFPDKTEAERQQIEGDACLHLAMSLLEFLKIPTLTRRSYEGAFRVEGLEHYEAARAKGKGLLVLTGHLGSFELSAGAMAQRMEEEVLVIVKSFPEALDRFVSSVRTGTDLTVVPAKGAIRPVFKAMKKEATVVFVQDQNSTRHIGVFVDFFGKEACTMSGLAVVALRTEAPVVGVSIWREAQGHVLAFHPEIPLEPQADKQDSIVHMTQVYTRFIEERIRENPSQWLWTHRRWKTQRTEH